jgi:hypothetical protein
LPEDDLWDAFCSDVDLHNRRFRVEEKH